LLQFFANDRKFTLAIVSYA